MNNPFIIAEIGINANSSLDVAKRLIEMAKNCRCDAVKFQKRTIDLCYTKEYLDSYRDSPWGKTQRAQKEGLEFSARDYHDIDVYCKYLGIPWFASAWDIESQKFFRQFDLKYNKIASPMIKNRGLVEMVAKEKKFTFISVYAWNEDENENLNQVVRIFRDNDCPFMLMHCPSTKQMSKEYYGKYMILDDQCQLNLIQKLKDRYNCPVGFSDHNPSLLPTSLAVALGAEAIEVHITLDRTMYGTDQSCSFERKGLEYVVRDARIVREIIGK